MEIIVTPSAKKQITRLHKLHQAAVVVRLKKIELETNVDSTKLSGYKNVYRTIIGDYRIVYQKIDKRIYIILVGHRKEVYKILDRLLG